MPRFKDQAICIRLIDWSETSQIVSLLTETHGQVRGLAKGSKRTSPSSVARYSGGIDLLTRGEVLGVIKHTTELATLTEWDLQEPYRHLHHNLRAQQLAFYAADLAGALLADHDPHPNTFHALAQFLADLVDPQRHAASLLSYHWMLLEDAGYKPQLNRDARTGQPLPTDQPDRARKWYTFDPHAGGITLQPHQPDNGSWRVRTQTVNLLRQTAAGQEPQPASHDTLDRANKLLCSYTRAILDRQLPTMTLLLDSPD